MKKHLLTIEPKMSAWEILKGIKSGRSTIVFSVTSSLLCLDVVAVVCLDVKRPVMYLMHETPDKTLVKYPVFLLTSECNYGGYRYWFKCPIVSSGVVCGRRVGTLYRVGDVFGCRHCYNLTYPTRHFPNKQKRSRALSLFYKDLLVQDALVRVGRISYAGKHTASYRRYLRALRRRV